MNSNFMFAIIGFIVVFIYAYRKNDEGNVYKYIMKNASSVYNKYSPYSYTVVRDKARELGQDYTKRQYSIQIMVFATGSAVISYLYFYNLLTTIMYVTIAVSIIPYLAYLRFKRIYSEYIFEQIQVYTTNVIMEFATTQSFVKAMEGVYESGVLEDPVKSDVKRMIDMAYENGTIFASIEMMNQKYPFFIVKNMHQLFLQITNEGSRDAGASLDNMSLDIDMLIESVYRDRMDRSNFHKKFLQFGIVLYLMVMLIQFLVGVDLYIKMLDNLVVQALLHAVVIINTGFLLNGEKYYNENVGAE